MRHPDFGTAPNIDLGLGSQLKAVGIDSLDRLIEVGAREAWLRLRGQFPLRNNEQALLALQGAIDDVLVPRLPASVAAELRRWFAGQAEDE